MDPPTRRGNYDSGQDYVLEYGELRFTFNERDFSERVEQAGAQARLRRRPARATELEDLVNLTVNGEVQDPGVRARRARQRLLARARRPRRALARALAAPARVPLRLARPARQGGRARRRLRRGRRTRSATSSPSATTSRSSSRPSRTGAGSPTRRAERAGRQPAARGLRARLGDRLGAGVADQQLRAQRAAAPARSSAGKRRSAVSCGVERDDRRLAAERRRRRRDHRQRAAVGDVARRGQRAPGGLRRQVLERVDHHDGVAAAGGHAAPLLDRLLDGLRLRVGRRGERQRGDRRGPGLGQSPTSSGRTPASTTSSSRPSRPASAPASRAPARSCRPAAAPAMTTREPLPNGVSHSTAFSVDVLGAEREALGRPGDRQILEARALGDLVGRAAVDGVDADQRREALRAARARAPGRAMRSPDTSSQRLTCAAEM